MKTALCVLLCLALFACKGTSEETPKPSKASAALDKAQAQQLFARACAPCHGLKGKGDGPRSRRLGPMPDFTTADFQSTRDDAAIRLAIDEGKGRMPGFKHRFGEHEINALVGMVRDKKE